MYNVLRPLLFSLNPEVSHTFSLNALRAAQTVKLLSLCLPAPVEDPVEVMGIRFPNRVGLAAGLDKNGDYINALGALGFGFIEIGTITPRPQAGNAKPRLFRLREQEAIINRMGFNNKGVAHLVKQVRQRKFTGVLGINIGKNAVTPVAEALDDYRLCLREVYGLADYITVNISSPNTPGLRDLQFGESLDVLLRGIKSEQKNLAEELDKYVPVVVKIAPDMDEVAIDTVAHSLLEAGIDGVIATNTTVGREGVEDNPLQQESGGLSGAPVRDKSTQVIRRLSQALAGRIPIIGVGGIVDAADAEEKIAAGAALVQLYSGFIYRGPGLVHACAKALRDTVEG